MSLHIIIEPVCSNYKIEFELRVRVKRLEEESEGKHLWYCVFMLVLNMSFPVSFIAAFCVC